MGRKDEDGLFPYPNSQVQTIHGLVGKRQGRCSQAVIAATMTKRVCRFGNRGGDKVNKEHHPRSRTF